jgi:hypothetical protein
MTTTYNRKVNTDGTYPEYTVVEMIKNDLSCIENYIKNNKLLSSSYHMTAFNIWSNNLLFIQKKWLKKEYPRPYLKSWQKIQNRKIYLTN